LLEEFLAPDDKSSIGSFISHVNSLLRLVTVARGLAMKAADRRYLAWGVGLASTAALPLAAGFTTVGWEISEILGFAAALACLALCGSPVRPRQSVPPVLLSLSRHELLGWIALGAAALHVLVAAITDRTVFEYLKPSAPLYQWAGIVALLVLLVLTLSSVAGSRRRLWRSHRNFQATHIALGCLALVLLAMHVITADRYTRGYGRRALFIVAAVGGVAMLLRRRRGTATAAHETAVIRSFAFGRHSTFVVSVIVATVLALTPLLAGRADVALREPLLRRSMSLPLDFDHGKHTAVNCLACHHNYADGRGFDACIHCHRSERADLKVGIEARFHTFCFDCHRAPDAALTSHGPVSGCESCHHVGAPAQ
jgi:DMSO/TMAO reductase YedYZ heme-binding membrane subunit